MLHPDTELKHTNSDIGLGVFASDFIPAGTVVYVKDWLEISISQDSPFLAQPEYREFIYKYSYTDFSGELILSWDNARFINHSCGCNSLSTGYGFEIAVKDIFPGEELTDDYGLFIGNHKMNCECGSPGCRGLISLDTFDECVPEWDRIVKKALENIRNVNQPLLKFIDYGTYQQLSNYLNDGQDYCSVMAMKYRGSVPSENR